jgi:hypothetical protein
MGPKRKGGITRSDRVGLPQARRERGRKYRRASPAKPRMGSALRGQTARLVYGNNFAMRVAPLVNFCNGNLGAMAAQQRRIGAPAKKGPSRLLSWLPDRKSRLPPRVIWSRALRPQCGVAIPRAGVARPAYRWRVRRLPWHSWIHARPAVPIQSAGHVFWLGFPLGYRCQSRPCTSSRRAEPVDTRCPKDTWKGRRTTRPPRLLGSGQMILRGDVGAHRRENVHTRAADGRWDFWTEANLKCLPRCPALECKWFDPDSLPSGRGASSPLAVPARRQCPDTGAGESF